MLQELAGRLFAFLLIAIDGVQSVYCAGSMARRDYQPGESDIDLIVLIKDCLPEQEIVLIKKLARRFRLLNSFLRLGSLQCIFSPKDIRTLGEISKHSYIFNPAQWRLLSGKELSYPPFNLKIPVSNLGFFLSAKIWRDTMFEYYFAGDSQNKISGIRKFHSITFKICRLIALANRKTSAENIFDPAPYSFIAEIRNQFLKELCLEIQRKQGRISRNQNVEFQIAEICARTTIHLDNEVQKYFEKQPPSFDGRKFEQASLPFSSIDSVILGIIKHNLDIMLEDVDLIIHHQSTYHILLKPNLPPDKFIKTLLGLKQKLCKLSLPYQFKISTPYIFCLGVTTEPIGYSSFLRDSQIYRREPDKERIFLLKIRPDEVFLTFSRCVFAKNSAFLLEEKKKIPKLKFVLIRLMQCRLFLDKGELTVQGEEAEKYRRNYSHENETLDICALFKKECLPGALPATKELELHLWSSCNYLMNKIYKQLCSRQYAEKAQSCAIQN